MLHVGMSSNAYMREYMKRRYHERRAIALKKLGGRCAGCHSKRGLEVDHKDRTKKTMTFTHMRSVSLVKFMKELENCQLLCRKCHEQKSIVDCGHTARAHGNVAMYRHGGCRCDLCRSAHTKYSRRYLAARNERRRNARTLSL